MIMEGGGFGIIGAVDLKMLDIDSRRITLGFDFDLNLLLFAIEREGFDEVLLTTNSTDMEDPGPSIAFDLSKWVGLQGRSIARPLARVHKGVWAIQGHRAEVFL